MKSVFKQVYIVSTLRIPQTKIVQRITYLQQRAYQAFEPEMSKFPRFLIDAWYKTPENMQWMSILRAIKYAP